MSLRLAGLQQQVQKELEALERETRSMREHLAARDEEANAMRKALRALEGKPEIAEPVQRRPPGEGEAAYARTQRERGLIREGILRHLQSQPGLTAHQLAGLIQEEWGEGPLSVHRVTRSITYMPEVVGDAENGYMYVPAENEGDNDAGRADRSK